MNPGTLIRSVAREVSKAFVIRSRKNLHKAYRAYRWSGPIVESGSVGLLVSVVEETSTHNDLCYVVYPETIGWFQSDSISPTSTEDPSGVKENSLNS